MSSENCDLQDFYYEIKLSKLMSDFAMVLKSTFIHLFIFLNFFKKILSIYLKERVMRDRAQVGGEVREAG